MTRVVSKTDAAKLIKTYRQESGSLAGRVLAMQIVWALHDNDVDLSDVELEDGEADEILSAMPTTYDREREREAADE